MKLKIGIDIYGVADTDAAAFSELTHLLVGGGHEVHLLTGTEWNDALERWLRDELGLVWTHAFSVTSHHKAIGTEILWIDGHPHVDEETWNRTKAEYCARNGVHLHLDDSPVYGRFFETPYAKYYPNRRPARPLPVAILGGSFNPVTNAHLAVAHAILREMPTIRQVWLMPAYQHPFEKHNAYSLNRVKMLRMAETRRIRYFGYEIDHKLTGETYVTFSRLLQDPDYQDKYEFHMAVGSDCVLDFDRKWRHAEELARIVKFIVVPRPDAPLDDYDGLLSRPPHTILENVEMPDISSTQVRRRRRAGKSIRGLVPERVERFILEHGLYREDAEEERYGGEVPGDVSGETAARKAARSDEARGEPTGSQAEAPESLDAYPKPAVRVDIAICTIRDDDLKALLIRREHPPFEGQWAIPGGFVDVDRDESVEGTAARQLEAETGLRDMFMEQLRTYGEVDRDPRGRVITVGYYALVAWDRLRRQNIRTSEAGAKWFSLKDYRRELSFLDAELAFDHDRILRDLLTRLRGKISYTPIAFELVPERFTWPELRRVYEIVLDKPLDAANFKRKIRSMYRIRELKGRGSTTSVGRPPRRLKLEGVKEMYV
ncbi:MAG: NUDIX domain-containing protein [Desulfococcaceae bacterium]